MIRRRLRSVSPFRRNESRRLFLEGLENRLLLATVVTDKPDYAPAETALITASDYQVGETVKFQVLHIDGTPNTGNGHEPWSVTDGGAGDLDGLANGNIGTSWFVDPDDSLGATFELSALGLSSGLFDTHTFTDAAPPSAGQMNQWDPGNAPDKDWVTGNNDGPYFEGDTVPYYLTLDNLVVGNTYRVTIGWDTTKSGKHAFDYLQTYNQTIAFPPAVDPATDAGLTPDPTPDTLAIPLDPNVPAGIQDPGNFTMYYGDMTGTSSYLLLGDYTGDSTTLIAITFVAQDDGVGGAETNVVLIWGGHIATRQDWGPDSSAVSITGSPYHMRLGSFFDVTNTEALGGGNQDRSLSAEAVVFPATITIIKDTQPNDPQNFSFTTTGVGLSNFTLDDDADPTLSNTVVFSNITDFGDKTITELATAGFTLTNIVISESGTADSTFVLATGVTTLRVQEGENITVTYTNTVQPPVLVIAKDFTNPGNDGPPTNDTPEETATAGSSGNTFFITVTNTGPSAAENVTITDLVPAALTVTNVTGTLGTQVANPTLNDNDIAWLVNSLGAGQSVTLTVTYSVGANVDTQLVNNTATADSDETTPVQDSDDVQIVENVVLVIAKDFTNPGNDGPPANDTPEETATAGSSGNTFFIIVTNTGVSTAENVTITDLVPAALTVTNVTGTLGAQVANPTLNDNDIAWLVNSLGAGQSVTLTVTYSVGANVDTQLVNNTATADSDETTPVQDSDDVQIVENVVLVIAKDFTNPGNDGPPANDTPEETATAGSSGNTFFIIVTNTGVSTAENVTITDLVPAALTVTNVTGTLGTQVANPTLNDNDIAWLVNSLGVGQSVTLTVTYSVGANVNTQLVNNTATADSDETTPVQDSDDVQIVENVVLVIAKDFTNPGNDGPPANDTPEETATAGSSGNTFFIIVTNTGISTAENVTITDLVPAALTVTNVTGTLGTQVANPTLNDNDIAWLVNSLGVGQSVTLTVTYSVGANVDTQLVNNTATADSDETTPVQDSDDVQIVENVVLVIAKDFTNPGNDGPPTNDTPEETATAGSSGNTFFIIVTNTGVSTADNVTITDLVPAALTVTNVTGTLGAQVANPTLNDNDIAWLVNSLGVGQSVTLTVTYSVGANVDTQLVLNTATADSDETTPVQDSDDVQIVENVVLVIAKDFSNPGNDGAGDTPEETAATGSSGNTFFIIVTNTGVSTADNVTITDLVPAALTVTNVTGTLGTQVANPTLNDNDIAWLVNSLGAGQSVTLTVTYSVGAGVPAQLVNNTATTDSDETTPVQDSDDVQIVENVVLVIAKDFTNPGNDGPPTNDTPEETAVAGSSGNTFFIIVTNTGVSTADNVTITDLVPAALTVTNVTGTLGTQVANPTLNDNDIAWLVNSLGAGQSVTLTVTYSVGANVNTQLVLNTATTDSDETTPVQDSDDVQIVENVTLVIAKDFTNPGNDGPPANDTPEETATAGSSGNTFFIIVTNTGVSTADNVTITDLVPAALTVTNVTGTLGAQVANPTLNDNDIAWLVNSLGAGQSVTLTVTYSVGANVDTQLVLNTATTDSDETTPVQDSDDVQIVENVTLVIAKDFTNPGNDGPPANDTPEETATAGSSGNTFFIIVTNTGISTAENVTITDLVPAALTVTNVTGTLGTQVANPTLNDNDIAWLVNSLGVGQSVTLTVTYSVGANVDTQLVNNTATADSDETTPVQDSDDVQIVENVVLVIAKDFTNPGNDGPPANDTPEETATAGSSGNTFFIIVTNTGISTAENVTITDLVPAALTVTNVTGTLGAQVANPTLNDNDIAWLVNSLGVGQSVTLTVTYSVGANVDTQLVNNTATADSDETTPVQDSDDVQIVENVVLVIAKDFTNPGNDAAGDTPEEQATAGSTGNTFFIIVTNTGVSTADNVVISDLVPAALTVTNVSGTLGVQVANPTLNDNDIAWSIPSLGAGQSVTLTVTYSVGAGVPEQLVDNTATTDSDETTPVQDSDDVQIVENVVLVIAKDFTNPGNDGPPANDTPEETVTAGSSGNTFFIIVTNTGVSTADNVLITDVVPAALTVTNVTGTLGAQVANPTLNDNDIQWLIPTLGGGQSVTLTVTYSVGANVPAQLVDNTAFADSNETTPVQDSDDVQIQVKNIIIGPDKQNCSLPYIHIVNSQTGEVLVRFKAYDENKPDSESYLGGVRVATGDLTGDGVAEIVTVPGRGYQPLVRIWDQQGNLLTEFLAFSSTFVGGVDIAVGDVNGDGFNDIAAAMNYNGNEVTVFKNTLLAPAAIPTFAPLWSSSNHLYPFGSSYKGGATIELADMGTPTASNAIDSTVFDGKAELIIGSETGMAPTIKVFGFFGAAVLPTVMRTFNPFNPSFHGGMSLDVARVNADPVPDMIVGAGNGGASEVQILDGLTGGIIGGFFAFTTPPSNNAPVDVAALDQTGDGIADVIFAVQGSDGDVRELRIFNAQTGALIAAVPETSADFCGAYFVATIDDRSLPVIEAYTSDGHMVRLLPYGPTYFGDVRVATGDLTGDGIDEIITAPGRNYKPLIRIFSQDGVLLEEFLAYSPTFKGGVDVEIGDVTGDHQDDIVTAMSYGGNQVKVFRNPTGVVLGTPTPFNSAYNFGSPTTVATAFSSITPFGSTFKGGAVVELADMGAALTVKVGSTTTKRFDSTQFDGKVEVVVANGSGMRSTVKAYSYFGTSTTASLLRTYLPLDATFRGGLSLDLGDVNGDLVPDVFIGAGKGGASQVQVLDGVTGAVKSSFQAFNSGEFSYNAKLEVEAQDTDLDGIVDFLLAAHDFDGKSREVRSFQPLTGELVDAFFQDYSKI